MDTKCGICGSMLECIIGSFYACPNKKQHTEQIKSESKNELSIYNVKLTVTETKIITCRVTGKDKNKVLEKAKFNLYCYGIFKVISRTDHQPVVEKSEYTDEERKHLGLDS